MQHFCKNASYAPHIYFLSVFLFQQNDLRCPIVARDNVIRQRPLLGFTLLTIVDEAVRYYQAPKVVLDFLIIEFL